jgi:hypothetical protein
VPGAPPRCGHTPCRGRDERIGQAAELPDYQLDAWAREPRDDHRREEADRGTGGDVARIVQPHEDPTDTDEDGREQEERADPPAEEADGKSNRKGRRRMVARERWIVRGMRQE